MWSKWRKKLKSGNGFLRPRTFLVFIHMGGKQLKAGEQKSPQNAKAEIANAFDIKGEESCLGEYGKQKRMIYIIETISPNI